MSFLVQLTDNATHDLEEVCGYIEQHDAPGQADYVLDQIEKALRSLSEHPRGGTTQRNCWTWEFESIASSTSGPTSSYTA